MLKAVGDIAYRRNHGDAMAEGSRRLAEKHGARNSLCRSKAWITGLRTAAMVCRDFLFATSNRGGCHLRGNMLGPEMLGVPKIVDHSGASGTVGLLIYSSTHIRRLRFFRNMLNSPLAVTMSC